MDAAELRRVKVAVLHVDDDSNKVPLDGDLLVSYLNDRGKAGTVTLRETAALPAPGFQVAHQDSYREWNFSVVPTPWVGMSL